MKIYKILILEDNINDYNLLKDILIRENISDLNNIYPSNSRIWDSDNFRNDENRTEFDFLKNTFTKYRNKENLDFKENSINDFFRELDTKYSDIDFYLIDSELATGSGDNYGIQFLNYLINNKTNFVFNESVIIVSTNSSGPISLDVDELKTGNKQDKNSGYEKELIIKLNHLIKTKNDEEKSEHNENQNTSPSNDDNLVKENTNLKKELSSCIKRNTNKIKWHNKASLYFKENTGKWIHHLITIFFYFAIILSLTIPFIFPLHFGNETHSLLELIEHIFLYILPLLTLLGFYTYYKYNYSPILLRKTFYKNKRDIKVAKDSIKLTKTLFMSSIMSFTILKILDLVFFEDEEIEFYLTKIITSTILLFMIILYLILSHRPIKEKEE